MTALPSSGDLLIVDGRASVQFAGERALTVRIVSVCDRPTYPGWIWLTGYVLNRRGEATAKRELYVQLAGLRYVANMHDFSTHPRAPPIGNGAGLHVGGPLHDRCLFYGSS
ncbi:hypothetical protein [Micromonospora musae]|uniref:hypothetical protein n=1 Tax=Micromonospora musae TaxID=1894970 RepID=UPI001F195F5B|nr:hypothetical protein [Micromonospora musae]